MGEEEPTPVTGTASCLTPGCTVEGVTVTLALYACAVPPTYRGQCGPCGKPYTNITV